MRTKLAVTAFKMPYGISFPLSAVRVKFSQKIMNALQKLLPSTYQAYSTKENDLTEYLNEEFYFTDIIYAHNGSLEYNRKKLLTSNKDKEEKQENDLFAGGGVGISLTFGSLNSNIKLFYVQ